MTKRVYVVMDVVSRASVAVDDGAQISPLFISWADGMIGAMPVFKSKKTAKKYGGDREIMTLEQVQAKGAQP